MDELRGKYLDDITDGMTAVFSKTVTEADIVLFAGITGDTNPVHLDEEFAKPTMFKGRIAHGMLTAGFISAVFGTKLPGPGCVYISQNLKFKAPVKIGDTIRLRAKVVDKKDLDKPDRGQITLDRTILNQRDEVVQQGQTDLVVQKRP